MDAKYKDWIPGFLILDMHVRNKKSGISSLYIAKLVSAQHKKFKTYAVLAYEHVFIIWSYSEAKIPIFLNHFILIVSLLYLDIMIFFEMCHHDCVLNGFSRPIQPLCRNIILDAGGTFFRHAGPAILPVAMPNFSHTKPVLGREIRVNDKLVWHSTLSSLRGRRITTIM